MEDAVSNLAVSDGAASGFLADLPSRGLLSSTVLSSNLGGMRVYVCDHDTSPPVREKGMEVQIISLMDDLKLIKNVIKTNQANILIRSLQLKGQKRSSSSKDGKGATTSDVPRKRTLERAVEGRAAAKRNKDGSKPEVAESSSSSTNEFYSLTVEKLRALLKERGLSPKGKKDELVARLKSANG